MSFKLMHSALDKQEALIEESLARYFHSLLHQACTALPISQDMPVQEQPRQFMLKKPGTQSGRAKRTQSINFDKDSKYRYLDKTLQEMSLPPVEPKEEHVERTRKGKLRAPPVVARVLPKSQRLNPFAPIKPIKAEEISRGVYNLMNQGVIPSTVDISPAFSKNGPLLNVRQAKLNVLADEPSVMVTQDHNARRNESAGWSITQINHRLAKQHSSMSKANTKRMKIQVRPTQPDQTAAPPPLLCYPYIPYSSSRSITNLYFLQAKLSDAPAFNFFLRHSDLQPLGGDILEVVKQIQRQLAYYCISCIYVKLEDVLKLAFSCKRLSRKILKPLLFGSDKINPARFPMSTKAAARVILRFYLRMKSEQRYAEKRRKKEKEKRIIRLMSQYWMRKQARTEQSKRLAQATVLYNQQQREFHARFEDIIADEHVRIEIPNSCEPNCSEVVRLFQLASPHTCILILVNRPLSPQLVGYYHRILDLNEVRLKERLQFFEVDPAQAYPQHFRTTSILYLSSKAKRSILQILRGRPAFMVCSKPHVNDMRASLELGIPILSGEYERTLLYSSKLGALRLFKSLGLLSQGEAISPRSTLVQFYSQAQRVASKWEVDTLFLRQNNGTLGFGNAVLSIRTLNIKSVEDSLFMIRTGRKADYLAKLLAEGGVVTPFYKDHTSISVNVMVDPRGSVQLLGTYQRVHQALVPVGCVFPQNELPHSQITALLQRLQPFLKELFGYVTLDLMKVEGDIVGCDIQCFKNRLLAGFDYFAYLMKGRLIEDGHYEVKTDHSDDPESRTFLYLPSIEAPGLKQMVIKTFFPLCRSENISFDLVSKFGATFVLTNSLSSGNIGVLCVDPLREGARKMGAKVIKFLLKLRPELPLGDINLKELAAELN